MKTVKIAFLTVLCCLTVSLFAAPRSDQSSTSGGSTGPTDISLWYGLSVTEAAPPPANWSVLQLIKDRVNINLTITNLPSSGADQDTRILAAAAANSLPDLFQVSRQVWLNLIRQGLVGQVDDLYALMPVRTSRMYDADAKAYTTINGRSYGFASPGALSQNEGILIRKDWLDKLGLAIPVTTQDYLNVMRAFTTRDPDGNGRADTYGFGAFIELDTNYDVGLGRRFDPIFGAFGVAGLWDMTSANFGLTVHKPAYYDALVYIKQMIDERLVDPNWISYSKDDFRAAWKQGRFGIMREQMAAYAAQANYAPFDQNFPTGEWIVIDPPRGPTGLRSVGVMPKDYRVFAVSARAIQQGKGPAIARLLEWMSSDEGYYLLGWGERGVNYVIGADGAPTSTGIPDPSRAWDAANVVSITQLRNMVFYNSEMELVARYPTYRAAVSGRTMSALTTLFDMQKRDWTYNDGSNMLPQPSADLERFLNQGIVEFVTGARPLTQANWTAWVAEFDRLGGTAWEQAARTAASEGGYLK